MGERLLLIVALSMLITPLFFILYEQISKRHHHGPEQDHDEITETGAVIIAGIGRFGQVVNRLVQGAGFSTVVLDNDLGIRGWNLPPGIPKPAPNLATSSGSCFHFSLFPITAFRIRYPSAAPLSVFSLGLERMSRHSSA